MTSCGSFLGSMGGGLFACHICEVNSVIGAMLNLSVKYVRTLANDFLKPCCTLFNSS